MIQASKIRALTTMLEGGEGQGKNSVSENLDKKEAQQQIETLQAQVSVHYHHNWQPYTIRLICNPQKREHPVTSLPNKGVLLVELSR